MRCSRVEEEVEVRCSRVEEVEVRCSRVKEEVHCLMAEAEVVEHCSKAELGVEEQ